MSDKATLLALADRVEALTGPCRETDAEIAVAVDARPDWLMKSTGEMWVSKSTTSEGPVIRWRDECMPQSEGNPPAGAYLAYTGSLDAAMTLVPEGWRVRNFGDWDDRWLINLVNEDTLAEVGARGQFATIALTAATIRALANGGSDE